MKSATIQLETLTCPSCMMKIEGALIGLNGVEGDTVKVLFNSSKAKLEFDEEKITLAEIEAAITRLGFSVVKSTVR
ncbi:MAG TPA: heavy-metal-associated domain-containing protein [Candidatus Atribacteria bacterium]|nr:heavy-metal-associated domain-containing protein [Candidatus Atribacteria bacterium]HPT78471.1 heavy-metal-associated domain-containing protein [Candidatus Atribacteria bacterium]